MSGTVFALKPPKWAGLFALAALAGCATTQGVQWGGLMRPVEVPEASVHCRIARVNLVEWGTINNSEAMALTLFANQGRETRAIPMMYDIDENGRARNIRYTGDPALLENGAIRDGIYRTAGGISRSRFAWEDDAAVRFATDCRYEPNFEVRII